MQTPKYTLLERRLRIATGVILATYVSIHLLNHSLGLVSYEAMEAMRRIVTPFWRSTVGGVLIYGSLITHFLLALWSLYRRSTLKMPLWEASQIILGLCVIPLAAGHIAANWGGRMLLDIDPDYEYVITGLASRDWLVVRQLLLVSVVWFHVCVGLHFWLRLKHWYQPALPLTYAIAVLLPLLALGGPVRVAIDLESGRISTNSSETTSYGTADTSGYAYDSAVGDKYGGGGSAVGSESSGGRYGGYDSGKGSYSSADSEPSGWSLEQLRDAILIVFYSLLVMTLGARQVRIALSKRRGEIRISHPGGHSIRARKGQTVLEAIRESDVPHASVCGGRARCTTCRVRIGEGLEACPPPEEIEQQALHRIGAEPNVRLACQTRPTGDVHIVPLVEPDVHVDTARKPGAVQGSEQSVVTMFVDLRGSTSMGEKHMPYDVLFILNRFFSEMTEALAESGGHYAQFAGDGLMALYGLDSGLEKGCREALEGAARMQQRIDRMNNFFAGELEEPLRIGIGIHCGEAIVGTMGPPTSPNHTAIGDSVNAAARLESLTKEFSCMMVVSLDVLEHASIPTADWPVHSVTVRGKSLSLSVLAVDDPGKLNQTGG